MQSSQGSHTESKPRTLCSQNVHQQTDPFHPHSTPKPLCFSVEPGARSSWAVESTVFCVQHKGGIDGQRGWISQIGPTPQHVADQPWELKPYSSPTEGQSPTEFCLRVLASLMCLQWAQSVAQSEATQPRQGQGSLHGEPTTSLENCILCTSLLAMRLWKGRFHFRPGHCLGCPLSSLLKLPVSLPSFYRDIWYSCCPCQCILLLLLAMFVKSLQRVWVYSVRIYEWALKQKTCSWISILSRTLITSHLDG